MQATTNTPAAISKYDAMIDSRDVIDRIKYLQNLQATGELSPREADELQALLELQEELGDYDEWPHGMQLISDTHFITYAQELAGECGYEFNRAEWPLRHIDWEEAARELKLDYLSFDFGGVEYWTQL